MQCCQHCGAKSWAPPKDESLARVPAHELDNILICDGCGEWGLKSVIESEQQPIDFRGPHLTAPAPFTAVMDVFAKSIPVPETRLERLVKGLMLSPAHAGHPIDSAVIVKMGRALEAEMDREELLSRAPAQSNDADFGSQ